jgi:hypothetical protein
MASCVRRALSGVRNPASLTRRAAFNEYFVKTDLDSNLLRVLPEDTGLPWSAWVGSAGMPGQTAYFSWKVGDLRGCAKSFDAETDVLVGVLARQEGLGSA